MPSYDLLTILFLLIAAHGLVDFSLQTEFIAIYKNRHAHKDNDSTVFWPYLLTAHSVQHGLAVFIITQRLSLGLAETAAHWITDFGKSEGWYGFHTDQAVHLFTKIVWIVFIAFYP